MSTTQFKVGDRVRITRCVQKKNQYLVGKEGTVSHYVPDSYWCWVRIDGFPLEEPHSKDGSWNFNYSQLELISPQSPQPQQTQQKEDTVKPYAVIYHNLTGTEGKGGINGFYTTEAEAKEAAEVLVSTQRANLTTKQFFAVTIVNTKTGKLVGSVVDAPPAVDWAS